MDQNNRDRLFQLTFWSAGVLYVWVIAMLWVGPAWGLSGTTYFVVGILPAIVGVGLLATSMGLYKDLLDDE